MSFYTLCLNLSYHDSSLALFDEDKLILFSHAERFSRNKYGSVFNQKVFEYILNNITSQIDILIIGHGSKPENSKIIDFIQNNFSIKRIVSDEILQHSRSIFNPSILECFSHHCTHALSAFYMSPFDEAVCLVVDALGSSYNLPGEDIVFKNKEILLSGIRGSETTSIIEVSKTYKRKTLYKRSQFLPTYFFIQNDRVFPVAYLAAGLYPHNKNPLARFKQFGYVFDASTHMDIGSMYETVTRHLNVGYHGHGKVMGMSAYGKQDDSIPPFLMDDTIYSNNNLFVLGRELNHVLYPELFGDISFEKKANIAYSLQRSLEKIFLHYAEFILKNSKSRNLIIGGGCALNILGVSIIKERYPEFNIFVDPIANDATHSIGMGIHYYNLIRKNAQLEKTNHFNSIYLGPKYNESEMHDAINNFLVEHKC